MDVDVEVIVDVDMGRFWFSLRRMVGISKSHVPHAFNNFVFGCFVPSFRGTGLYHDVRIVLRVAASVRTTAGHFAGVRRALPLADSHDAHVHEIGSHGNTRSKREIHNGILRLTMDRGTRFSAVLHWGESGEPAVLHWGESGEPAVLHWGESGEPAVALTSLY